ncbi:Crp/Fnr family transcriptional regulator [Pedobacter psychrodurus]|uniref:Crp/Fnr family transcriptional regulator n=1 Tax=Pedobacter psychrodurus TaxID=2530456 RepID=A0A4R0PZJ3_9SPHI|nr:Crp/Fnr family transcriptional regulator [Pedobacter psychrodurus]TCD28680.1 Crp/Fnr family transcriptional regulator [Pedobacter psychrodurus]
MHQLFNYINECASTSLSEDDLQILSNHFIHKKIRKKQYLFEEGDICRYMGFILKGALRKYYVDEKGNEHIVDLYIENWWIGDTESFVMKTASIYNIDAWEDAEILLITRENSLKLSSQCPLFNELLLRLDERNNILAQKRIASSISFSAEKRYEDFVNNHSYFIQRFPQHIIASYLGITKDTLSRIRRKALKR